MRSPNEDNVNKLKLIHLNVQCIRNKIDKINVFLHQNSPDIFCVSEHWLTKDEIQFLRVDHYNMVSNFSRCEFKHGGVAVFTKNTVSSIPRELKEKPIEKDIEFCALDIDMNGENIVVATFYRSPLGNLEIFF